MRFPVPPAMKSFTHPYRKPQPPAGRTAAAPGEELILYVALCVVGAIPVATTLARGGAFGVEPTLGLLMVVAGIIGLLAAWRPPRSR